MERVSLINGPTKNKDYDLSALGLSIISGNGGVYEGLVLSNVSGNDWKITKGKALVKCLKTSGYKVLAHFELDTDKTFTQVGPFKVWIEINQTNLDNPTANNATGTGAGSIQYGASYPAGNYLAIGEVDSGNVITTTPSTIIQTIATQIINNIQSGGVNFFALSTGTGNSYEITYSSEIPSSGSPSSIAQDTVYYFKGDKVNTANVTISVNTQDGVLTAPLKKMNDLDLTPGDIEIGLIVGFMYDGTNFQMTTPTANAPVGSSQTVSISGIVGEETGSVAGKPAFVGYGIKSTRLISQINTTGSHTFGDGNNLKVDQKILTDKNNIVRQIIVRLKKNGTPTDNVVCKVLDKNRTVLGTSTNVYAGGLLGTTSSEFTFNFSDIVVDKDEYFFIELSRSGSQSSTNYFNVDVSSNYEYPHGNVNHYDGSGYIYRDGCFWMKLQFGKSYENGKWYISNSDYIETSRFDGVFEQAVAYNGTCSITLYGANNNQFGMIPGSNYYIDTLYGDKNLVWNTDTHFGYQTTNQEKLAQQIMLGSGISINKIWLNLYKAGTPTDNAVVRIETDLAGSPSGTLVSPNAVINIQASKLVTSSNGRPDIYNFAGSFNLDAGVKYWIVLQRSGLLDTVNFFRAKMQNTSVYTFGSFKTFTSSAWATQTRSLFFSFLESYNGTDVNTLGERSVGSPNADDIYIGYSRTDNIEHAQMMMSDKDITIDDIMLHIRKDGSPTDNMELRIETNKEETPTSFTQVIGNVTATTSMPVGNSTSQKVAGAFTTTDISFVQHIDLQMSLNNTPSDGLTIRIETDNSGSPSGTLVHSDATMTIANISTFVVLGNSLYSLYFPKGFEIPAGKVWIVISRTGSIDNTNYVNVYRNVNQPLSAKYSTFNGTSWSAEAVGCLTCQISTVYMQNKPSGQLLDPNSKLLINGSQLTTTYQMLKFNFPGSFIIPKNTKFWLRVRREDNRNLNTTNFFRLRSNSGGTYGYGYTLTAEATSSALPTEWKEALYGRNIVLYFNFVYMKDKYLRKDQGVFGVGNAISSTGINLAGKIVNRSSKFSWDTSQSGTMAQFDPDYELNQYYNITGKTWCMMTYAMARGGGSYNTQDVYYDDGTGEVLLLSLSTTETGTQYYIFDKGVVRIRRRRSTAGLSGMTYTNNNVMLLLNTGI